MGLLKIAAKTTVKIARQGTHAVTAPKAECEGCGKALRGTKKTVCSTACAQFVAESYR